MTKSNLVRAVAAMSALSASAWWSASAFAAPAEPGLERIAACQACHGVDGVSIVDAAPNLAGQHAAYLQAQLKAFRSEDRKNPMMNAIAAQLSDDEIAALAKYWASLPSAGTLDDAARHASAVKSNVTFPKGFPKGFAIYASQDNAATKTITRNWANKPAFDAAKAGKPLPLNAVIVEETVSATDDNGALKADKPVSYAIFAAAKGWGDAVPELLRNGDWHYGLFKADKTPRLTNQATCLACHKALAKKSFAFTYGEIADYAKGGK